MKRLHVFALMSLIVATGLSTVLSASPARAQATSPQTAPETIGIAYFYKRLAPSGEWVQHARLSWVWYPTKVDAGWRPYTHGRWILTEEYGWFWQSDEDWGWADFHYGRWCCHRQTLRFRSVEFAQERPLTATPSNGHRANLKLDHNRSGKQRIEE